MRIPRFYHSSPIQTDTTVSLTSDASHHCINVLRLKLGTSVVLFDGTGNEFAAELVAVSKREAKVNVLTQLAIDPQSPLTLHLGQSVSKGDRMDWVLQKATELGATDITPLITKRSTVKLSEERWQKKHGQWLKVIIGACEQCGRNTLPTLHSPISLTQFIAESTNQTRLFLSPTASEPFSSMSANHWGYRLVIGPEGGLDDSETHLLSECGYKGLTFGPRILRTETAAIAALSVLQFQFGDLH